jgi:hypothetical protein
MAAIIAAVAALLVALIGLLPKPPSPATKAQPPTTIEQKTSGPMSPTVGQAGGNVTITNEQPSTPKQ